MKRTLYKGEWLAHTSQAYQLWLEVQKAKGPDKNKLQKQLDLHLKRLNAEGHARGEFRPD